MFGIFSWDITLEELQRSGDLPCFFNLSWGLDFEWFGAKQKCCFGCWKTYTGQTSPDKSRQVQFLNPWWSMRCSAPWQIWQGPEPNPARASPALRGLPLPGHGSQLLNLWMWTVMLFAHVDTLVVGGWWPSLILRGLLTRDCETCRANHHFGCQDFSPCVLPFKFRQFTLMFHLTQKL